MGTPEQRIVQIAGDQAGLITRRQALDAGLSENHLRSRLRSGFLVRAGARTYRLVGAPNTNEVQLRALMMDVGGEVWGSLRTAAALHGLDGYPLTAPFDVTILRRRDVKRVGHRIHTTTCLDPIDRTRVRGMRVTSVARTLIDLARVESTRRLTITLDSALRDGKVTEDLVHRRIVVLRSSGRFGIPKLLDAIEGVDVIRGAHSYLERRFLELVAARGLPRPETQRVTGRAGNRVVRVDFWFPGTPVVVETLGYRWHRSRAQMNSDAARMNSLVARGLRPYQFTYDQVIGSPDDVIDHVAAALTPARAA
jgi:very-short-patch-repair endonuclease